MEFDGTLLHISEGRVEDGQRRVHGYDWQWLPQVCPCLVPSCISHEQAYFEPRESHSAQEAQCSNGTGDGKGRLDEEIHSREVEVCPQVGRVVLMVPAVNVVVYPLVFMQEAMGAVKDHVHNDAKKNKVPEESREGKRCVG